MFFSLELWVTPRGLSMSAVSLHIAEMDIYRKGLFLAAQAI